MKVLFIIPSYHNGGVTSCLRNLVGKLSKDIYSIEVFAITDIGPNRDYFLNRCTVLNAQCKPIVRNKANCTSKKLSLYGKIAMLVKRFKKSIERIGIDISPLIFKHIAARLEARKYDVIIAFQEGLATHLGSYIKETKKIAWIHCDYTRCISDKSSTKVYWYQSYQRIVCVGDYVRTQFIKVAPKYEGKTTFLHNIMDDVLIKKKSLENVIVSFDNSAFTIVSLGRLDPVKRFDLIPQIASKVKAAGIKFKWYIFGGGFPEEASLIKDNIESFNVADVVILAGEVNNPYPYIKQANLLVSTSSSEACPCVFSEAFILHTPVLSADFGSASEYIINGLNGWISTIEAMDKKLIEIISNTATYNIVLNSINEFEFDNQSLVDKFNKLVSIC
jgi:glycosyltransferase involved in cell wall biosynthesis